MSQIPNDPPIDEVREVRHQISARFNHDPSQLVAYYLKLQQQFQDRLLDTAKNDVADQDAGRVGSSGSY
jgi:hypothetical protein